MIIHKWHGRLYEVTNDEPKDGDLVLTDTYGVWVYKDVTGSGSAPMPYWANKKYCKVLKLIR